MAFCKMIAQLILAIEHLTTIGMSAREEGAVVLLHMTTELSRTTKGSRAPVRTLRNSSDSDVVDLAVDWRDDGCSRNLRLVSRLGQGYILRQVLAAAKASDDSGISVL